MAENLEKISDERSRVIGDITEYTYSDISIDIIL